MRPLPILDERLSAAAALFPACDAGADIGADHGRLSCCLLASGRVKHMTVSDVSADSLEKAKRLLQLHGLSERADFAVADGLAALSGPVDALAILGMGGAAAARILSGAPQKLRDARLILSAHTDLPLLRETISSLGYKIENERAVCAKGRYYVVLSAARGAETLDRRALFLGPRLSESAGDALYARYLLRRAGAYSCMRDKTEEYKWLREEIERVRANCASDL